jgi:hypothetical protein
MLNALKVVRAELERLSLTEGDFDLNAKVLGPREVPFVAADGREGVGSILIRFGEPRALDIGHDAPLIEQTGTLEVEVAGLSHTVTVGGGDDLQVAFYLMRIAGVWLMRVAEDEGLTLFDHRPDRIVDPMEVFDC